MRKTMITNAYAIDATDGNKVFGFSNREDAQDWINRQSQERDWRSNWDSEQDFIDNFYIIDKETMDKKVKKFGKRVKQYWT